MSQELLRLVEICHGEPWAPAAFVGALGLASLAMPISLFVVAGGVLFGFWGGVACNTAGTLLGASAAFWIARRFGQAGVETWLQARWPGFAAASLRASFTGILAARLLGLPPFGLLNYLAGLSHANWKDYLAATLLGGLPWTILVTYFSQALWTAWRTSGMKGYRAALSEFTVPFAIAAVAAVAIIVLGKRLKKPRS